MAIKGRIPTPDESRRIVDTVLWHEKHKARRRVQPRPRRRRGGFADDISDAITTGAITPATDAKTGSTTFGFTFLVPDPDNTGDLTDGDSGTGTNRSLDLNVPSGTYIVVAPISGEWRPVWVDCG